MSYRGFLAAGYLAAVLGEEIPFEGDSVSDYQAHWTVVVHLGDDGSASMRRSWSADRLVEAA